MAHCGAVVGSTRSQEQGAGWTVVEVAEAAP